MAGFDINGARAAGYSDQEIQQFLLSQPGVDDARKAGYNDQEILQHYGFAPDVTTPAATAPQPIVTAAPAQDRSLSGYARMAGQAALRGVVNTLSTPGDIANRLAPGEDRVPMSDIAESGFSG